MGKTAFVFPGQGAAAVGMGRDVVAASPAAAAVWQEAAATLPDLARLCFEGPLDALVQTANAQPALLATFSRPLPRYFPCSFRPPLLYSSCTEDPASQEGPMLSGLCIDGHDTGNRQGKGKSSYPARWWREVRRRRLMVSWDTP